MNILTRRFNLVHLLIAAAVVAVAAVVATLQYTPDDVRQFILLGGPGVRETPPFSEKYGPGHFSQFAEEWIARDFFHDRRDGVFADIGANDYKQNNTTYYLETALGWRGIGVDAQREYADGYTKYRPRTQFFSYFVGDRSDQSAEFYIPANRPLDATGTRQSLDGKRTIETREVPAIRLDDLLARAGFDHIDYLSMDIELGEPKALDGFDIARFKPQLACIEAHVSVRQAILDYFYRHGYVLVGKYLRVDAENLYLTPAPPS